MIKWLRRALIILAIAMPVYWVVSISAGYSAMALMQEQASELQNERTKAIMRSSVTRFVVASISDFLRNLAMSCLCLFAAHKLDPLGKAAEVFD